MGFLVSIGILIFGAVAQRAIAGYFASKRKPPIPGSFQSPVVASGTTIPVLYGTRAVEGITTWFHGAKLVEVNTNSRVGPFGTTSTKAYQFKVTMQQVLGWGPVLGVRNILFGEKSLADQQVTQQYDPGDGTIVTIATFFGLIGGESNAPLNLADVQYHGGLAHFCLFLPNLFGGRGRGGGVTAINGDANNPFGGSLWFKGGTLQYGPDPVMEAALGAGNVPSYSDLAAVIYDDVNVGESPTPPRWRWILYREPPGEMWIPGAGGPAVASREIAGLVWSWTQTDLSAAAIIYDLLRNPNYGLGEPEAMIAQGAGEGTFEGAHNILTSEGLGVSMLFAGDRTKAQDAIDELLRTVDGMLVRDPVTFKRKLKLLRNEAPTLTAFNALRHFDDSDIIALDPWSRAEWTETMNVVTVEYSDAALNYETNTVTLRNEANIAMTGGERAITIQYPSVTDRAVALKLCARDLRALSLRLRKGQLKITRAAWDLERGDVFRLSFAQYGLDELLVRVMGVDLGDETDNAITLDLVEDVFQYEDIARVSGTPSDPPRFPTMTRPAITATTQTRSGVTDTLAFTLLDSEHRVTEVAVRRTVGGAAPGSWDVLATGTTSDDLSDAYSATVAANALGDSVIDVRVAYDFFDPAVALTLVESFTFPALSSAPTAQTLVEADPIVWDVTARMDDTASFTLTANRTLSIIGAVNGFRGALLITSTAPHNLTLPTNSLVRGGTSNVIALAGGHERVTVTFDGTRYWWNYEGAFVVDTSLAASVASGSGAIASLSAAAHFAAAVTSASSATGTLSGSGAALAASVSSSSTASLFAGRSSPVTSGLWTHLLRGNYFTDAGVTRATTNADPLYRWGDVSGHGRHGEQTTAIHRPELDTSATYLSDPTARTYFTSASPTNKIRHFVLPDMSGLTEAEIFIVVKADSDPSTSTGNGGLYSSIADFSSHYPYTDGVVYDGWGSTTRKTIGNLTTDLSTGFHVYNVYSKTNDWQAFLDGISQFLTATNTVAFPSGVHLGEAQSTFAAFGAFFFLGNWAEVLIFDHKLTSLERAAVTAFCTS